MHNNQLIAASLFGGSAVALGAFGAHGLAKLTADTSILHGFETAVQYQLYHAITLLFVGLWAERNPGKWLKWASICFIAGIVLFSGSLYLLTFLKIQESNGVKFVGPVTPVGGLLFIIGWLFLLITALRRN
ncbi:MAG: DUF423 domain-containing protein [Chitinophagaceae bacterium]